MMGLPLIPYLFDVRFQGDQGAAELCAGQFSEVSGLEATMEPKVIREGGHYNGEFQRVGQVTYATVILKRGMTGSNHLWAWFDLLAGGKSSYRLTAVVTQFHYIKTAEGPPMAFEKKPMMTWTLNGAMPTKFKAATMNAQGTDVGVEELHFVHEGMAFGMGGAA